MNIVIHIKTPATTANMGPGFDCIGMAFKLYNNIWVEETLKGLIIETKKGKSGKSVQYGVPLGESNLVFQSILKFYEQTGITRKFKGLKIIQEDYIPLTRGLGSSAACVVAGLLTANELSGAKLPKKQIAEITAKIETHPDNSTPAIMGGMIVSVMSGDKLEYIKLDTTDMTKNGLRFGAIIPDFPLSTEQSKSILPETYSLSDVVFNTSRAALMVAALMSGDYDKLMAGMDDCIHQPYREKMIPSMSDIFKEAKHIGVKSVFLSGSGPAIIAIYDKPEIKTKLAQFLNMLPDKWEINELEPDNIGATVTII